MSEPKSAAGISELYPGKRLLPANPALCDPEANKFNFGGEEKKMKPEAENLLVKGCLPDYLPPVKFQRALSLQGNRL